MHLIGENGAGAGAVTTRVSPSLFYSEEEKEGGRGRGRGRGRGGRVGVVVEMDDFYVPFCDSNQDEEPNVSNLMS